MDDTYRIMTLPESPKEAIGCIDLVESPDDGGWYAQEYDFRRADNATRTTKRIYPTRAALVRALDIGATGAGATWKHWS